MDNLIDLDEEKWCDNCGFEYNEHIDRMRPTMGTMFEWNSKILENDS